MANKNYGLNGWLAAAGIGVATLASACTTEVSVGLQVDDSGTDEAKFVRSDEPISDRYIVVLKGPKDRSARSLLDIDTLADKLADRYDATVDMTWKDAVLGFAAGMSERDAQARAGDEDVAFVEEDGVVHADATQNNAVPGLDRIDQQALPLNRTYNFDVDGSGVTAFVIDTGIRITHTEFGGRARSGFSAINDGRGTDDCNGHGTHVAGTIGGKTFGVAKNVNLVAVRVLDCNGSGANSGVVQGINFVTQNHQGPSVANMSLGGGASRATDDAVNNAINSGVVMAVAAGNENADACNSSPARAPNAITVGAIDARNDTRAGFSNFGSCVDISGPGVGVLSSSNTSDTATANLSGTSMATPHVAGAAALVLSANPGFKPQQVRDALVGNASRGIKDLKGSPDANLFTGFIRRGGGEQPTPPAPPAPPPAPPAGKARTGSADSSVGLGQFLRFNLPTKVLAGTKLTVNLEADADADLFVRFGGTVSRAVANCKSESDTGTEVCDLTVPGAPGSSTTASIGVFGFEAATFHIDAAWVEP